MTLVTTLLALVLAVAFPTIVLGRATFAPGARLGLQSGLKSRDYPYKDPPPEVVDDGAAFAWQFEPWAYVAHREYAAGTIPLWNPDVGLGAPLAGNLQSAVFTPFSVAVMTHPTQRVWDLTILIRLLAGGVGCYALLRVLGARPGVALAPAAAYMLAPVFVVWAASVSMNAEVLAPWLLVVLLRGLRRSSAARFAAVAVVVAAVLLSGQPEVAIILGYVAAAWTLAFWWTERRRVRRLIEVAAAALAGVLLAAPLLLLAAEYVPLSSGGHVGRLGRFLYSPRAAGMFAEGDFGTHHRAAVGMVLTALAVGGLALRRSRPLRVASLLLLGATAVWVTRAFDIPLLSALMRHAPGIGTIDARRYGELLPALTAAVLAVTAIEAARSRRRLVLLPSAAIAILLATAAGAGLGSRPQLAWAAAVAGLVTVALGVIGLRPRLAPLALLAVAGVQFAALVPHTYARPIDPAQPQPFMRYLQAHIGAGERVVGVRSRVSPDWPGVFGVADANSVDALYPARSTWYAYHLLGGKRVRVRQLSSQYLDAIGVRYVVGPAGGQMPPSFHRVFVDRSGSPIAVWRNADAFAPAWLASHVQAVPDERAAQRQIRASGGGDLHSTVVVEAPTAAMRTSHASGTARILDSGPDREAFDVDVGRGGGVLVASQIYYPGWEAFVDGHRTPIRPADVAMRAIAVPAGHHRVVFEYRPSRWVTGLWLALLGLGMIAVRAALPAVRRLQELRGRVRAGKKCGPTPAAGGRPAQ